MLPLARLDGDLKSGASMADLILIMGLNGWGRILSSCQEGL
jgi:hypothetical protein